MTICTLHSYGGPSACPYCAYAAKCAELETLRSVHQDAQAELVRLRDAVLDACERTVRALEHQATAEAELVKMKAERDDAVGFIVAAVVTLKNGTARLSSWLPRAEAYLDSLER